ncbi:hypothetical protein HJFPF1_07957 [Paramyrothecium foliicola]|nr:hypothetical protein HJFPF1_07957 [Paramyrothecium foliicola]
MDIGYNPHAERTRRKNRSSTNLSHLSLAPLTVKLPLDDDHAIQDSALSSAHQSTSYLSGKSAPTTPRLLSRSPIGPRSRSHHRTPSAPGGPIAKSKSSSHLVGSRSKSMAAGAITPKRRRDDGLSNDATDSDWLLRTGALMSSEAREYKGQAWLVSRQSSTSLAGMRDAEDVAFEEELAREREMTSRLASRRGSSAYADEETTSPHISRFASRSNSRSRSHPELRSNLLTPLDRPATGDDSYFSGLEPITGPDFVNLDEKLEELERDTTQDDEAAVRRLVKHGQAGAGSWISNVIGWSLFSVEENEEDSDDGEDESLEDSVTQLSRSDWPSRHFEGVSNLPEDKFPPPKADEGGWQDAAWLLSVATKVMF